MPITLDVKFAQWIATRWERPSTIIILILLIFFVGICKFTGSDLGDLTVWEFLGIISTCALVYLFWRRSVMLPRSARDRVGFAIAIDCESEQLEKTIVADFVGNLRRLLNEHNLTHKFDLVRIPQAHAARLIDADAATRARVASRCQFLIYGNARVRQIGGKTKHILNLDFQVAHRPIPKQISQGLATEMSELFPRRLHIDTENDLISFEFTSEWIDCVAQYTIGIASSLSGDLDFSESLFLSLLHNKHLQHSSLPPFQKMRQRLPIQLGEIYGYRASQVYEKWQKSRAPILLNETWQHLVKLRNYYPEHYSGRLLASICFFVLRRDVAAAIKEIKKCRTTGDGTWRYNYAFLLAYSGNLMKARRMYETAFHGYCARQDVPMQAEDFMLWILDLEPNKIQIHFCLGLVNWRAKGDLKLAMHHFQEFIQKADSNAYPEPLRLAKAYVSTLAGEFRIQESKQNKLV